MINGQSYTRDHHFADIKLWVFCMWIVVILLQEIIAIINLLVNPAPKNVPYTILIESNYICSFQPKWLLTCRHFCLPPHCGAWSQARHMTSQGQKIIILHFLNLILSLIIGCLQSTFSHPSSSHSHFTLSVGHIQLPYYFFFLLAISPSFLGLWNKYDTGQGLA